MVDIAGRPRLRFGDCFVFLLVWLLLWVCEEEDAGERKCEGGKEDMVCGFNIGCEEDWAMM